MSDDESNDQSFIIKLRGLPWTVTTEDIRKFLDGVNVSEEDGGGVHLITYSRNSTRPNGEAFVVCATEDDYKKAFYYNKKNMGHRYIESKLPLSLLKLTKLRILNRDFFLKFSVLDKKISRTSCESRTLFSTTRWSSCVVFRGVLPKRKLKIFSKVFICYVGCGFRLFPNFSSLIKFSQGTRFICWDFSARVIFSANEISCSFIWRGPKSKSPKKFFGIFSTFIERFA